jgi:hypothetical protein
MESQKSLRITPPVSEFELAIRQSIIDFDLEYQAYYKNPDGKEIPSAPNWKTSEVRALLDIIDHLRSLLK